MTEAVLPAVRVTVPCGRPGCRLPVAFVAVEAGQLVLTILSRHHGEQHSTQVGLGPLVESLLTGGAGAATVQMTPAPDDEEAGA